MNNNHEKLFDLLEIAYNSEGDTHILAIAEKKIAFPDIERPVHQVRVALTYKTGGTITPYFDGTDLYVAIHPNNIHFVNENEWSDGPPIMEGSPIELALEWVSELAPPFWISPEARTAAVRGLERPPLKAGIDKDVDKAF